MPTGTQIKERLDDVFDMPEGSWHDVVEDAGQETKVDGKYILARMEGPVCLINGASRNRRYYTESLWQKAATSMNERIQLNGGVPGVIGHKRLINDDAIESGLVSHKVTKMWIPPGSKVGMAEILIFGEGTAGVQLNTYLRGGWRIPVSTRGFGKYNGKMEGGIPVIDDDSFFLESIDFVGLPGVKEVNMTIRENDELNSQEEQYMPLSQDDLRQITEALGANSGHSQTELFEATKQLNTITEEKAGLAAKVAFYEKIIGSPDDARDLYEGLRKWIELPAFKGLAQETGLLNQGALSDVPFNTAVKKILKVAESYMGFGSPDEIDAKMETLDAYQQIVSTPEKLIQFGRMFQEYVELGAPGEVRTYLEKAQAVEEKLLGLKRVADAKELAEKHEQKVGFCEGLLERMTKEDAENLLKTMKESDKLDSLYKIGESGKPEGATTGSDTGNVYSIEKMVSKSITSMLAEGMGEIDNPQPVPARA